MRQIGAGPNLAGLSRFFSEAPWEAKALAECSLEALSRDDAAAGGSRARADNGKSNRSIEAVPSNPSDHPYLIGDDSTMHKPKGKKMEGLGRHHSTTEGKRIPGQSMVQSLYVQMAAVLPTGSAVVSRALDLRRGRCALRKPDCVDGGSHSDL